MNMRIPGALAGAVAFLAGPPAAAAAPARGPALVAWVQYAERGAEARLVTEAPACPAIRVDGRSQPMRERAAPSPAFANRVCAASLRAGAKWVEIAGARLAAPRARPQRIVVLGDSGCRLKGLAVQACDDPAAWPFARIAAHAAARRPDLVVHVGDYYYRESACPPGFAGCAGSPHGDVWASWKAELFDPAAPLLAAAPVIFARGNHEDCRRGGPGWFRLLDAAAAPRACPSEAPTWSADLGGLRLMVVDSADQHDVLASPQTADAFAARLAPLAAAGAGGTPVWILTHRPIWATARLGNLIRDSGVDGPEREAVRGRDLGAVQLVLSGHVHNFTALSFGAARPAQLIVGTGGDTLNLGDSPPPATGRARVDGRPAEVFTMGRFGYLLLERRAGGWDGTFYDAADRPAARCLLQGRVLACQGA
jgi:hypothetical protein